MVRRHFHRQMPAFRNPGLHSFAEKKSKWEKVGKAGKRCEKAGNPALNPEESAGPSRLCPLPAHLLPAFAISPLLHDSHTPFPTHSISQTGSKPRLVIPLPIIPLP